MSDGLLPFSGNGGLHAGFNLGEGGGLPEPGADNEYLRSNGDAWESSVGDIPEPGAAGEVLRSDGTAWKSAAIGLEPWFEWNGTDLSQFDAAVVGSAVAAHTEQVTAAGGLNWIDMSTTCVGGGGNGVTAGVVLPISTTPPSADYVVVFEFISITRGGGPPYVGAGAVLRYTALTSAYYVRFLRADNNPAADFGLFVGGPATNSFNNMYDPNLTDVIATPNNRGERLALMAESGAGGAGILLRAIIGEQCIYLGTSPYTSVGKAGLWNTSCGLAGATVRNYYRNIKCYLASDVANFEM